MRAEPGEITKLLQQVRQGKAGAESRLMKLLYTELHAMAGARLRHEREGHTLSPTALVHETYLRLAGKWDRDWHGRPHFLAVAAQAMRHVLVDYARARIAKKRGAGAPVEIKNEDVAAIFAHEETVLALDEALTRLAQWSPRQCRVVELRYFGGLTEEETAEVLHVARRTVNRDWEMARAWLWGELRKGRR